MEIADALVSQTKTNLSHPLPLKNSIGMNGQLKRYSRTLPTGSRGRDSRDNA